MAAGMPERSDCIVPLAVAAGLTDVSLVLALLRSAGIRAVVSDFHMVTIQTQLSQAIGGASIGVFARDLEAARALLAETSPVWSAPSWRLCLFFALAFFVASVPPPAVGLFTTRPNRSEIALPEDPSA